MSVPAGTRIGPYAVVASLGAGGMGEVYRARDTKLDRDVAIKVLPPDVAGDAERIARFSREAKTLGALNHPNIAHIYSVEDGDGQTEVRPYIVMELVEGEDLAERLKRGPIPLDEALPIARQIAEGLEAAHEQGIIHRDLKPANIKVRPDGTVKVLDFGLAKALDQNPTASTPQGLTVSPTITTPAMTMRGVILGTAAYMSPEQAKGKTVDRRADIWAFGCVLYEMLTGTRTFAGEDISDTLVSVLRDDPRWAALPPETPPAIRRLLDRCLQKDPQKRLPHIGAARLELAEGAAVEAAIDEAATPPARASLSSAIAFALIGAAIAGAAAFAMWPRVPDEPPLVVRFAIRPPAGESSFVGANMVPRFSVSPDGRTVVYQTQNGSASRLWMRTLDTLEDQLVAGSESSASGNNVQQVFWSPDSQHIAFFDQGAARLKRMPREGGGAHVIAEIESNQLGGTWNKDGVILMASLGTGGIRRVAASGGAVTQVTQLDAAAREGAHLWPEFFPDDRHFVYLVTYVDESPSALFVASIDGGAPKRLIDASAGARPVWPDRLLYIRDGALVDQRFDINRLELTGEAAVIAAIAPVTGGGRLGVSASSDGRVLAYSSSTPSSDGMETTWLDRNGRELAQSPPRVAVSTRSVRLSPDGTRLAFGRNVTFKGNTALGELWTQDLVRGIEARVSSNSIIGGAPLFSPDGATVATRRADSPGSIQLHSVSGAAPPVELKPTNDRKPLAIFDWSPDGSRILFGHITQGTTLPDGIRVLPLAGDRAPLDYLAGVRVQGSTFSPDGKYVAVTEGELGESQVFIRPFPDAAKGRWVVSPVGGRYVRWRRDGRELYFVNREGYVMAVPISLSPKVEIGTPVALFQVEVVALNIPYDVSPDGQRFVTVRNADSLTNPTSIIVTVNRGLAP